MFAQFVVQFTLAVAKLAEQCLLRFGGKFGEHLLLRAPQEEGSKRLSQKSQVLLRFVMALGTRICTVAVADASNKLVEVFGSPKHAGIEKLEQRPELAQMVFHRSAGHGQSTAGAQQAAGLGCL